MPACARACVCTRAHVCVVLVPACLCVFKVIWLISFVFLCHNHIRPFRYASYHSFNDSIWIRHSGQIPYQLGLTYPREAHLVHTFFRPTFKAMTPVYAGNYDWWTNHGVHLYQRFNTQ